MIKGYLQRGALFIEYALVLAFVAVIGSFFISDKSVTDSIAAIFGKTNDTIAQAINPKKTVAQKNADFTKYLVDRIKDKFKEDNALKGYIDKTDQNIIQGTDSENVDLYACFATRWKSADPKKYAALIDDISYTFYANKQSDGSYTWDIYIYNPESNGNKKLNDKEYYNLEYIQGTGNSIVVEHYQYNDKAGEIIHLATEDKKVGIRYDKGFSYNVIRDVGREYR